MIIISPAKRQDSSMVNRSKGLPVCLPKTQSLLSDIVTLDEKQLRKALDVSEAIGKDAWATFQSLAAKGLNEMQVTASIDLYQGDVYKALDVQTLTVEDLEFMENNLRILSAFYGLLKPLDGIWPYRLEMGSRLPQYPDLAQYWAGAVTEVVCAEKPSYIFNLASVQYAKAIHQEHGATWVDIVFQDKDQKGQYRVIAVRAKKMRGLMLRYMVKNRVTHPEQLLGFNENNYVFNQAESSPTRLVFRSI